MQTPARLTILLAQHSPQALVIRRGPSKHTAIIGWNRKDDTFVVGQWIKGKIVDSDISPNGQYWIYTAMGAKSWHTWTAVARVPYLKALDFYRTGDYWPAFGRFLSNKQYCFGELPSSSFLEQYKNTNLTVTPAPHGWQDLIATRNGWERFTVDGKVGGISKRINAHWNLQVPWFSRKQWQSLRSPIRYLMKNTHTGAEIAMEGWEWADVDGGRLVWAEKGLVMAGVVMKDGVERQQILYDSNHLTFAEMIAPY